MAETGSVVTPRRAFLVGIARAAGVAGPVLGLLEGEARALPRAEGTDLEILYASLALEHHAIALYEEGLRRGLFVAGLRAYAVEFHGDHLGHRDTQVGIAEERGGRPPLAAASYDFGRLESGAAMLRQALGIEIAAQQAYTALISQIRTKDYLLAASFVLVDEVRHMTVWQRALGARIY